jgi:hypothetical protein
LNRQPHRKAAIPGPGGRILTGSASGTTEIAKRKVNYLIKMN